MVQRLQFNSREEWLNKRTSFIGGSDASAIVGRNPYMTNIDLWEIKTGRRIQRDISNVSVVKYGVEAEHLLRELFILDYPQYKVDYVEHNIWLNDKYPFAHASLDGWLTEIDTEDGTEGRKGVWECKTTEILQSMQKEKWKDKIPDNYYIQILHYLMVTEFDFAVLKAQLKYNYNGNISLSTKHYNIEREEVLDDIEYLAEEEAKFAEYIRMDKRPPLVLPDNI